MLLTDTIRSNIFSLANQRPYKKESGIHAHIPCLSSVLFNQNVSDNELGQHFVFFNRWIRCNSRNTSQNELDRNGFIRLSISPRDMGEEHQTSLGLLHTYALHWVTVFQCIQMRAQMIMAAQRSTGSELQGDTTKQQDSQGGWMTTGSIRGVRFEASKIQLEKPT